MDCESTVFSYVLLKTFADKEMKIDENLSMETNLRTKEIADAKQG